MPYIIDGHNLIPRLPGFSLNDLDDEMQLVKLLQEFCRLKQKKVEVFFDNLPAGGEKVRKFGAVTARFVRQGSSADEAIKRKLVSLKGDARNYTVVSSDHEVQTFCRAVRAQVISSEVFVDQLLAAQRSGKNRQDDRSSADINPDELKEWLEIFEKTDGEDGNSDKVSW